MLKKSNGIENFLRLDSLTPNTAYEWKVASLYGKTMYSFSQVGNFSDSIFFTTASALMANNQNIGDNLSLTNKSFVYPNPAHGYFNINNARQFKQVKLLNMTGFVIKQWNAPSSNVFTIGSAAKGVYLVQLINDKTTVVKKIVIE